MQLYSAQRQLATRGCELSDLILAIDQGTSATKAGVFAPPGELLGTATVSVGRSYPEPGAVVQDPFELLESCKRAGQRAIEEAGISVEDLAGCALANPGETFVLFKRPRKPSGPVIGWQDTRCGDVLRRLEGTAEGRRVSELTGLPLHAEFTAPKLSHFLQLQGSPAGVRFGTIDTWIIACLDPGAPHVIDRATASRTMLIGLEDEDWNPELLEIFSVPREILPEIRPCDRMDASIEIAGRELPLLASGYDMGLALLGHGCFDHGELKATFGTCLGVMAATGSRPLWADGLLTSISHTRGADLAYCLDGEIAGSGSLVGWAVDAGIADSPEHLAQLADQAPDAGGVVLVPALSGLGAPYWRDDVRGRLVGLTTATGRPQLARAIIDAVAYTLFEVVTAIEAAGLSTDAIRVDGGLTHNRSLMQRCADVCRLPLQISAQPESTALGAAWLAMLARGDVEPDQVRNRALTGATTIEPGPEPDPAELAAWRKAVAEALAEDRAQRPIT